MKKSIKFSPEVQERATCAWSWSPAVSTTRSGRPSRLSRTALTKLRAEKFKTPQLDAG